ncbi:MAG: HflX-like GTP-binding protein, partial [Bdellovibrionota bacterium]
MTTDTAPKIPRALLVSIKTPQVTELEAEESLKELGRLVHTLGFQVIATESQNRPNTTSAVAVGRGKLKDLAKYTGGSGETGDSSEDEEEDDEGGLGSGFGE